MKIHIIKHKGKNGYSDIIYCNTKTSLHLSTENMTANEIQTNGVNVERDVCKKCLSLYREARKKKYDK